MQTVLGITEELPAAKQNTGRINLCGSIATGGGLVFIGATNDNALALPAPREARI